MPVSASAKKALRRDRAREAVNKPIRSRMHNVLRQASEEQSPEIIPQVYSIVDRAAKKHIIHKNKAARLKSRIQRTIGKKNKKTT